MKRYLLCCVASAALGGLGVLYLQGSPERGRLSAQEPARTNRASAPSGGIGFATPAATPPAAAPLPPVQASPAALSELTAEEQVNISVYDNVNRGVVNINTKGIKGETFFFVDVPTSGVGSGSVLDRSGHILTNNHVIEGAKEIEVGLFNGKTFAARLVGEDPSSDLAILQIDAPAEMLFPVVVGDSAQLKVGQRVFAIGNPFGLERTLTTGIVSSLNRSFPTRNRLRLYSLIQIDAAINPGNSGGPLLDSRGRLIGMTTAIASKTGQSAGVGFAIPASTILRIVPHLIEKGRFIRPEVGIARVYETEQGLLIASLVPGGPAEKAGLHGPQIRRERKKQGPFTYDVQQIDRSAADVVVAVDGQRAIKADEFLAAIDSKSPGDEITITVIRKGQEVQVRIRLVESQP